MDDSNPNQPTDTVTFPHDKAFKAALSNINVAKDFLESYLPEKFKRRIDLATLQLCPGSFTDEALKQSETDVLYRATLKHDNNSTTEEKEREALIYCLVEHQRKSDEWLPFRLVKYCCHIWDQYRQQTPEARRLPVIIPLVLYNGDTLYSASTDFFDLFGAEKALAQESFLTPFQLVDLNTVPDEVIRQHLWSGLLETLLKHARQRDLLELMEEVLNVFILPLLSFKSAKPYLTSMIYYGLSQGESRNQREFLDWIHTKLPKELEENTMTFAEQLIQEGMQKGMQKGVRQGRTEGFNEAAHEIAKNILQEIKDPSKVAKMTGLSKAEVEELLRTQH